MERNKKLLVAEMLEVELLRMGKEGRWKQERILLFNAWATETLPANPLILATRFSQPGPQLWRGRGGVS